MSDIYSFEKLEVWKLSMELAEHAYKTTNSFPKAEVFGLTSQIRQCSISIPSNNAEGYGRYSRMEFQ